MGFFKKDEVQTKDIPMVKEIKPEVNEKKENEKGAFRKKNLSLFDVDTIQYTIENFPSMSVEIQNGLINLSNILENTIDYIEDKSSEIIKKNRDFKLSKAYRDTSISIYDVAQNIYEYVEWMKKEYEKNINADVADSELADKKNEVEIEEKNEYIDSSIDNGEEIEIYEDLSLKEPKGFKLRDNIVAVDDWDDLLVKTAEVLTKKYRKNKYSKIVVEEIKPVEKKSTQNSFRDTVIEMLNEYKISLNEFKIIAK